MYRALSLTRYPRTSRTYNYAKMQYSGISDIRDTDKQPSITIFDLWLSDGEFFLRSLELAPSSPNPTVKVDFSELQATSERLVILSEDYIVVDDPDTRLSDGDLDTLNIKLRISGISDGVLQRRADVSSPWVAISLTVGTQYREFSLADMRNGLIALLPASGAYTLTFRIQVADAGDPATPGSPSNLSDSDPTTPGAQAADVSIPVVALEEVEAGQKAAINDERPRGAITPDDTTLGAWMNRDRTLRILVKLTGGKTGLVLMNGKIVRLREFLSSSTHSIATTKITTSWDSVTNTLLLQGTSLATVSDFQAVLDALELHTVRSGTESYRTISVRPDLSAEVSKKDYFVRDVKVDVSSSEPILEVGFGGLQAVSQQPLILTEDTITLDDTDTVLGDGSAEDPVRIKFRITGLSGGVLQRRAFNTQHNWVEIPLVGSAGSQYREFSLFELRNGLVSFLADSSEPTLDFHIQAADDDGNLSDSDLGDDNPDPISVSIPVVAPKEIVAGKEMLVNDDNTASGDGLLTPDDVTLGAWITASNRSRLRVLVTLHDRRLGEELFLQDNHGITTITSSWSWEADIGTLSLQSDGSATPDEFQTVLNALKLRTARSAEAGTRTVSVRPDVQVAVAKRDDYTRVLLVQASGNVALCG